MNRVFEYEGTTEVLFTGTADRHWVVNICKYSPMVMYMYVNGINMQTDPYVAVDTDEDGDGRLDCGMVTAVESVSPYAALMSIYWDANGNGDKDAGEGLMDTSWVYTY